MRCRQRCGRPTGRWATRCRRCWRPSARARSRAGRSHGTCRLEREGDGRAVLGDPRLALTWLVNEPSTLGAGLAAGQFVTTGTCMVPLEIEPDDRVQAGYGVLGRGSAEFTT